MRGKVARELRKMVRILNPNKTWRQYTTGTKYDWEGNPYRVKTTTALTHDCGRHLYQGCKKAG